MEGIVLYIRHRGGYEKAGCDEVRWVSKKREA
jgi:hypothetical protein